MTALDYLHRHIIPTAFALLPEVMKSPQAAAMLLAIALQESGAVHRRQLGGPARGFWQFERAGVTGVRQHHATHDHFAAAMHTLCYAPTTTTAVLQAALADNDVLACVCARLNLWWLPNPLPSSDNPDEGWRQYLGAWAPGKPHRATWNAHYARAWTLVNTPLK